MVCPTCFCTSVDDVNVLESGAAERWRRLVLTAAPVIAVSYAVFALSMHRDMFSVLLTPLFAYAESGKWTQPFARPVKALLPCSLIIYRRPAWRIPPMTSSSIARRLAGSSDATCSMF